MKIKVLSSKLDNRIAKGSGKGYTMQELLVELGDERRKLELYHGKDSEQYKPGLYTISDSSFEIENKSLVIKWLTLEPVAAAASAPAARTA